MPVRTATIFPDSWRKRWFDGLVAEGRCLGGQSLEHAGHVVRGADHSVFEEISPERVVLRHLATVHEFMLEIRIEAAGDGSRIIWNQTFMSEAEYKKCEAFVPRCNEENLDRLEFLINSQP
jgi:hypothetical protein